MMPQYLCRYRKEGELRWISHLDLMRTLERAMRRARLPLELTQGHNPRPKLSFGPPLPLGATGESEVFAVHLTEPWLAEHLQERLGAQLPAGLELVDCWTVPGYRKKETFGDLEVAEYRVTVEDGASAAEVQQRAADLLAEDEVTVTRGGERPERTVDIRPMILLLGVEEAGPGQVAVRMRLRTGSHGGARPQEVLALLGEGDAERTVRIHRTALYAAGEAPTPAPPAEPAAAKRRWGRSRWVR
jgi:radical SAM-linked protein